MIEHYEFGHIVIRGKSYSSDVIIYPDHVDSDWWREEGHRLSPVDLWGNGPIDRYQPLYHKIKSNQR